MPTPYTGADALRALADPESTRTDSEDPYWAWALADADDRLMGKVGLSDYDGSSVNLTYWLHPGARGRGWMTIAAHAVTSAAHEMDGLAVAQVRASVAAENHASRRVLERAGFQPVASIDNYRMGDGSLAAGVRYIHVDAS